MRPSEFNPVGWANGGSRRAAVITALRRRPPAGTPWYGHRLTGWMPLVRQILLRRQQHACAMCAMPLTETGYCDVDHVVSLSNDGAHSLNNLQVLCQPCHREKTRAERRNRNPEQRAQRQRQYEARQALRAWVLETVALEPASARQLAVRAGVSTSRITGHVSDLHRCGEIERGDWSSDHGQLWKATV